MENAEDRMIRAAEALRKVHKLMRVDTITSMMAARRVNACFPTAEEAMEGLAGCPYRTPPLVKRP